MRSIPPYTMRNLNKKGSKTQVTRDDRRRVAVKNTRRTALQKFNRSVALEQIYRLKEDIGDLLKFTGDFDISDYLQELRNKLSYWEDLVGNIEGD